MKQKEFDESYFNKIKRGEEGIFFGFFVSDLIFIVNGEKRFEKAPCHRVNSIKVTLQDFEPVQETKFYEEFLDFLDKLYYSSSNLEKAVAYGLKIVYDLARATEDRLPREIDVSNAFNREGENVSLEAYRSSMLTHFEIYLETDSQILLRFKED